MSSESEILGSHVVGGSEGIGDRTAVGSQGHIPEQVGRLSGTGINRANGQRPGQVG